MKRQNKYLRDSAVKYAETYALNPNPNYRYFPLYKDTGGDCTNFVSQCLLAGGATMEYNSNNPWWYNNKNTSNTKDDTWSLSFTVAHSLYYYLKNNANSNSPYLKGLEIPKDSQLELGDLIFFEDSKAKIIHSTIVTSLKTGKVFVSQHSFNALNIYYKSSWAAYKYHFIKIII